MDKSFTIRAYHATTRERAEIILRDGFLSSQNSYDWLGEGIYFFQEAPNFAVHWASEDRKEGTIEDLAIVAADIAIAGFIDLLDHEWGAVLRAAYETLDAQGDEEFRAVQAKQKPFVVGSDERLGHWLDRYVIEASVTSLADRQKTVTGIRSAFWEGPELYPNSHVMDRQHIQVAVRDPSAIRNHWLAELRPVRAH